MNPVLARWNTFDADSAAREVLPCNGSRSWAQKLAAARPIADETSLIAHSNEVWRALPEEDWREAFQSHPRIGEQKPQSHATAESLRWSAQEQRAISRSNDFIKHNLAEANRRYEQKFGRIFLICASCKTSAEILTALESRMNNDAATELREAAEQQRQITELRLRRWLESR